MEGLLASAEGWAVASIGPPVVSGRHAICVIAPALVAAAQSPAAASAAQHVQPATCRAYVAIQQQEADMTTPTVTETSIKPQAATRDDFAHSLSGAWQLERPSQRDLVASSLLRCPDITAARRRS
jgi:hypothetical protein